jgi:hypothetical protein
MRDVFFMGYVTTNVIRGLSKNRCIPIYTPYLYLVVAFSQGSWQESIIITHYFQTEANLNLEVWFLNISSSLEHDNLAEGLTLQYCFDVSFAVICSCFGPYIPEASWQVQETERIIAEKENISKELERAKRLGSGAVWVSATLVLHRKIWTNR